MSDQYNQESRELTPRESAYCSLIKMRGDTFLRLLKINRFAPVNPNDETGPWLLASPEVFDEIWEYIERMERGFLDDYQRKVAALESAPSVPVEVPERKTTRKQSATTQSTLGEQAYLLRAQGLSWDEVGRKLDIKAPIQSAKKWALPANGPVRGVWPPAV